MKFLILLLALLFHPGTPATAQASDHEAGRIRIFELSNGKTLEGIIVSETGDHLVVKTADGRQHRIAQNQIRSIRLKKESGAARKPAAAKQERRNHHSDDGPTKVSETSSLHGTTQPLGLNREYGFFVSTSLFTTFSAGFTTEYGISGQVWGNTLQRTGIPERVGGEFIPGSFGGYNLSLPLLKRKNGHIGLHAGGLFWDGFSMRAFSVQMAGSNGPASMALNLGTGTLIDKAGLIEAYSGDILPQKQSVMMFSGNLSMRLGKTTFLTAEYMSTLDGNMPQVSNTVFGLRFAQGNYAISPQFMMTGISSDYSKVWQYSPMLECTVSF